jgi:hypothetical protein
MQGEEHMTDWTQEEDEAFNDVEKQSNLGKQILRASKSSGMDCCTYDCVQGRNCPVRTRALEEVALEFDKMPFGDTASSFASFVRRMKG